MAENRYEFDDDISKINSYCIIKTKSVTLICPIPMSFSYGTKLEWTAEDLHHIGKIAGLIIDLFDGNKGALDMGGDVWDIIKNLGKSAVNDAAMSTLANILNLALNPKEISEYFKFIKFKGNGETIIKDMVKKMGYFYNPNKQLYLNGMDLQEINLKFSLAPRSQEVANNIKKGLHDFEYAVLPSMSKREATKTSTETNKNVEKSVNEGIPNSQYLVYPEQAHVLIKCGGACVFFERALYVTSYNVGFGEGNMSWHSDGFPTTMTFDVSLKETTIRINDHINKYFGLFYDLAESNLSNVPKSVLE